MSHQTGITVSQELLQVWGDALQNGNTRFIKVQIVNGKNHRLVSVELSKQRNLDFT